MLEGLQKALREMFIIGLLVGIGIYIAELGDAIPDGIVGCMILGVLYSPLAWAVYRLFRFIVFPLRPAR